MSGKRKDLDYIGRVSCEGLDYFAAEYECVDFVGGSGVDVVGVNG